MIKENLQYHHESIINAQNLNNRPSTLANPSKFDQTLLSDEVSLSLSKYFQNMKLGINNQPLTHSQIQES